MRVATEGTRYTDARVKVKVKDVNDKTPVFEGLDDNKVYPAAVTEKTKIGDLVVKVTAIDADGTAPNNKVGLVIDVKPVYINRMLLFLFLYTPPLHSFSLLNSKIYEIIR